MNVSDDIGKTPTLRQAQGRLSRNTGEKWGTPTRRQWILRLGEMVALAGISGVVPEFSSLLLGTGQEQTELPPGLYTPSADALVHALSSGHKAFSPPPGSETDYVQPSGSPFQPQFFSQEEFRIITRFVEIMLGQVEPNALAQTTQWVDLWFHSAEGVRQAAQRLDPMHRALAVAFFGETPIHELETADPAAVVRDGLAALSKECVEKYGKGFLELETNDQAALLQSIGALAPESSLRKAFALVRGEAIRGYYTSAEGLKELDYKGNAYYAVCPGCELSGGAKQDPKD